MLPRITKATMLKLFPAHSDYQQHYDGRDYCQLENFGNVSIGSCKIRGYRDTLEDEIAHSIEVAKLFSQLNKQEQNLVLEETFKSLQAEFGQIPEVGSTACVTTAWMKDNMIYACNANLGDSCAILVAVSLPNKVSGLFTLTQPHNPNSNKCEKQRVEQHQPLSEQNKQLYLYNKNSVNRKRLAVSRSIGDNDMEASGLLHDPEFLQFMQAAPDNSRVFLITASDGLLEPEAMQNLIEETVYDCIAKNFPLHLIAAQLTYTAFHNGSGDNISVAVAELGETPVSLAIFDGHRGDIVAKNLAKHFYPRLKQSIKNHFPKINLDQDIYQYAIKQDWAEVMTALLQMTPAEYHNLNIHLRDLIKQKRLQLSDAFIDFALTLEMRDKVDVVKEVIEAVNGLGVVLNLPQNPYKFIFSQHFVDGRKTTGCIKRIHNRFLDCLGPWTANHSNTENNTCPNKILELSPRHA